MQALQRQQSGQGRDLSQQPALGHFFQQRPPAQPEPPLQQQPASPQQQQPASPQQQQQQREMALAAQQHQAASQQRMQQQREQVMLVRQTAAEYM